MASFLRKQVNNVGDRDARKADTVYNVILKTSFFIKKKTFMVSKQLQGTV